MGLCVHRNHEGLLETGKLGGREVCISNTYSHATLSPPERFCIKVGCCVSHFNVSLIVWAQSKDGVHKPQCLKRKESRSGSNQGPSAYHCFSGWEQGVYVFEGSAKLKVSAGSLPDRPSWSVRRHLGAEGLAGSLSKTGDEGGYKKIIQVVTIA